MQIFYLLRKARRNARRAVGGDLIFRILLLAGILLLLFFLHIVAMVLLEGLSLGDAAWLTITTATTVGYGDISAATPGGRWATVVLMYVGGIFVLAQLAGLIFEAAQSRLEQQRYGKVPIKSVGHIVIFGWREEYIRRVVKEIRRSITSLNREEIVVVSPNLEILPEDLIRLNVQHVNGFLYETETLKLANVAQASCLAILPETDGEETAFSDLELILRLREQTKDTPIILAAQSSNGRSMAEELGADDVLFFDLNYPDVFSRAILTVGAENIVDELIDRDGIGILVIHQPLGCLVEDVLTLTKDKATLLGIRTIDDRYELHPPRNRKLQDERLVFLADTDAFGSNEAAAKELVDTLTPLIQDRQITLFKEPTSVGIIGSEQRANSNYLNGFRSELKNIDVTYLGDGSTDTQERVYGVWHQIDVLVLLATEPTNPVSDAKTFLTIRHLRNQLHYTGRIIAEAVLPENLQRFEAAGATDVIRPAVRNVEILARCIATGAEEILDDLYGSFGSNELISIELDTQLSWGTLSERLYTSGLALAFERGGKRYVIPEPDFELGKGRLFLLVDNSRYRNYRELKKEVLNRL
ncbi:potassium channel family protein [Neolewinella antarctica]|uniref:Potassium channel domain-containing protein n=1 Tax=Neolewinella antarctica TaxID=442734 RepID=A0ABX0XBF6_9BACT|nr:potassium channel family protein [Neolewinella antarctica]NJC26532.1 hypothetical protein [Neolewinella antarctica]